MTKIKLFQEDINPVDFDDTGLPSDIHVIQYTKDGVEHFDAVRAYSKVDIFDEYFDKLGKSNPIHSIESGFGTVRPNLYNPAKNEEK